ncbi:MAG: ORF6N domain-containing protein [Bacteroidota bacterium]
MTPKPSSQLIASKIFLVRGQKVMLDEDLASLYGVLTKRLNEQVKRNIDRFPKDFMFQLTPKEFSNLKSQFATSSWGGKRKLPYAFTEHGILMLSGILNSQVAIRVNVQIIRIFIKMREMILSNKNVLLKLGKLEKNVTSNTKDIQTIFQYVKQLLTPPVKPRVRIGFIKDNI